MSLSDKAKMIEEPKKDLKVRRVNNASRFSKLDENFEMHIMSEIRKLDIMVVDKDLSVEAYESDPYDALYYIYKGKCVALELVSNYNRRFEEIMENPDIVIASLDEI